MGCAMVPELLDCTSSIAAGFFVGSRSFFKPGVLCAVSFIVRHVLLCHTLFVAQICVGGYMHSLGNADGPIIHELGLVHHYRPYDV